MQRRALVRGALPALIVAAGLAGRAWAVTPATVTDMVFNAAKYNGVEVVVTGEAREIKTKVSKGGKEYTLFSLHEPGKKRWVRVFSWGKPSLYEGRTVIVTGTFAAEKKVGDLVFKKEIEAKEIR